MIKIKQLLTTAAQKQAGEMLQVNDNEDYNEASELENKYVERPPVFSCKRCEQLQNEIVHTMYSIQ